MVLCSPESKKIERSKHPMKAVLIDPTSRNMAIFELQKIKLPHHTFADERFGYLNESQAARPAAFTCSSGQ
jgi:hypothetical protein